MMTIIVLLAAIYWIIAAKYCLWRTEKVMPEIEKEIVENHPIYNAMGCVPPPIKGFGYFITALCAPVLAPLFALDHLKEIVYKKRVGHVVKQMRELVETVRKQNPNHPDLPQMEKVVSDIEKSIA